MVNLVNIIRNKATGEPVGLHATGTGNYGTDIDHEIRLQDATLGELVNGTATLDYPELFDTQTFTFTLATHETDGDVAGKTAYDELVKLTEHTTHPHSDLIDNPSLASRINGAFLSIANIFGRLEALEALNPPPVIFDNWVVQGQELRLNRGGTGGDDCIIPVTNGFGGLCPRRIAGQPTDSVERMLTIEVNGAKHLLHIWLHGDTGRIADAIAQNKPTQTLGTPAPVTPDAG